MAEGPDAAVTAERAALADTRRRIGITLDEIDRRVRPTVTGVSQGVAALSEARKGLELLAAAAETAGHARRIMRSLRSHSAARRVLLATSTVGLVGALVWAARGRKGSGDVASAAVDVNPYR